MCANMDSRVLTDTFHPYCIGRDHQMLMLEKRAGHLLRNDVRAPFASGASQGQPI